MSLRYKKKKKYKRKKVIDNKIVTNLLIACGAVFLLIGMLNSLTFNATYDSFKLLIHNFFQPSNDEFIMGTFTGPGFLSAFSFFLPGLLLTGLSIFGIKRFPQLSYTTAIVSTLYLISVQIYFFLISYTGIFYYTGPYTPTFFLILSTVLLLILAFVQRKSALLILTLIFFYISVEIIGLCYLVPFSILFSFIFILGIAVYWITFKLELTYLNVVNYFFTLAFLAFFVLRKFYINSKIEYLNEYIIFSLCFYLLFLVIQILSANSKNKPLKRWLHALMNWSNLAFIIFINSFILQKYFGNVYLYLFLAAILILNIVNLLILDRYKLENYKRVHYLNTILLFSIQLPIWIHQNEVLLFTSVLSVLLLIYANYFKSKIALLGSISSLVITLCVYFFLWIVYNVPAITFGSQLFLDSIQLENATIEIILVLFVLWATNWQLKSFKFPVINKWLNVKSYNQFISLFLLISEFLTLGWLIFILLYCISGSVIYSYTGIFISGSIFFIILIQRFAGKDSEFKRPTLYLALVYVLLCPIFLGWDVIKENILNNGSLNIFGIFIHYCAIVLLVFLSIMIIRRIYLRNIKKPLIQNGIQFLTVIYLAWLICLEYDNITIIATYIQNSANPNYTISIKSLENNLLLAYSIILLMLSFGVFVYALLKNRKFLKNLSIVLFIFTIIKILAYDSLIIATDDRSILFYIVGVTLISLAIIYPMILKSRNKNLKRQ